VVGWRDVWAFFEPETAPKRSYTYDFEIYQERTPVEIWVAVLES
jgi:predicted transcriptional regulator YdeE